MTVDEAGAVRADDAFDVPAVDRWLRAQPDPVLAGLRGEPAVRQFGGGVSNLTYLLRYDDRELVLRRPPGGTKPGSGHDMSREFRVQRLLAPAFRYVPRVRALCEDTSVLGAEFYVMDRIPGTILRARLPPGLELPPERAAALCRAAVDTQVHLHSVDTAATGLDALSRGPGYVERQVLGWTERYARARTWNVPSFRRVTRWLAAEMPDDVGNCLIHNDFRLDNLVLDPADLGVVGVLDWELATIGDPLMDLGSSLAYWVQADDPRPSRLLRRQPSLVPGMLTRREMVAHYAERTGVDVGHWTFYEVFGLFRLAVIAQQIWYRYYHGQTTNEAYAVFGPAVAYLEQRARGIVRTAGG